MRVALICLLACIIVSCNRNTVRLDRTNADGEVPQLGNLTFHFSNALVGDSMLNRWDSTAYIRFEPAIEGRFRWEQADLLVFSPAKPLPPATGFSARFDDDILRHSVFNRITGAGDIRFYTPGVDLNYVNASWTLQDEGSGLVAPELELFFNYAVSPADVKDRLTLQLEGQQVPYTVQTLSDNNRVLLRLQGITPRDEDLSANLKISKGLVPRNGRNPTVADIEAAPVIPSPFNLVVNDVSAQHDGLGGIITLRLSQDAVMDDISSRIQIDPAVKFTVEAIEGGIAIKSPQFSAEKTYRLTLLKGIRGKVGGVLQEQYENQIAFGEMEPSLRFTTTKSTYLSVKGNRMLEMNIVNVPKLKVVVSKIYESNLLSARQYGYYPRESGKAGEAYYYGEEHDLRMGDVVYEQEIDTRSLPQSGSGRLFRFDLEDRLPAFKGIYHIKVRSAKDFWVSDSRFIAMSDLGLIAKEGRDKLFVFTNSIQTAEPLNGVNVIAYGSNNQVLGMAATNADGVAEIAYTRKEFAGFRPAMIIAKTENDFNYLPFGSTQVNTSRFEVGGKRLNSSSLDAFIYAERDIYRPGERLNFSVIVRDREWKIPGQIPLKLKFLLPNGRELKTFRKTLNEQGSLEGNIDIANAGITGTYTLEVYTSTDVLLGSKNFSIEEFVPDRIKVTAKLDKDFLIPGETARLSIAAVNFFGPPAAGRNYEAEIQVRSKHFKPRKFPAYDFGIRNQGLSLDKVVKQGKTDPEGNAAELYEVPTLFRNTGLLQANFYTTVFDETGRPVSSGITADIFTQEVFFGIADDGYWYYALNRPVRFPVIALNSEEQVLSGVKAGVKVIKHEYRTVLSKSGSYFRYESQEDDKLILEQTVTVSGDNSAFVFTPRSPGNYEIRIAVPGAAGYVSRKFYSYGSWGGDNNSFEVNTDGSIDIETDKSVYKPGETAKILFKAPFDGRLLVTMESDKVLSYRYVEVDNRNASVDIPVSAEHLPNVFVTATLIKPHRTSEIPLTVAHGFSNLKVEEDGRKNKVEIVAAVSARSHTKQQVTVKASPGSYVTLAAVDNGVLQVSNFLTPDPYKYFYAPRALDVTAYDLYPYLFPELRPRLSSTGGDGENDMQKRLNPMPSKRVQIVSYWSGIVKTNASGQANFSFDIPRFSGQVRLMAVAYHNNEFGAAETAITVADPLVLSTAMPRFLSPGDMLSVPLTITNTTSRKAQAVAALRTRGPVKVLGAARQSLAIEPNAEGRTAFSIAANSPVDTARIYLDVEALGEKFTDEIAIGIRPASPLQRKTGSGSVEGGAKKRLTIPVDGFMKGADYKLVVGTNPLLEWGGQLGFLVQYPFGCTEQVVSATFPQLYHGELAAQLQIKNGVPVNTNENILEAVRKLKLRQLYNGALTMWEAQGQPHWWSTVYAAHFLLEAQKAGYDVDGTLLSGMMNYINSRLRNKQTIDYYYNRDQKKQIAPKEVAYSLYVLALAATPNVPAMNYYKENRQLLSLDSKYLLSAAYAVAGDTRGYRELLPAAFAGEESVPQTGGSFYSPLRDEAIALYALIEVDPANEQVPLMAKHIADALGRQSGFNTQEAAFSFLALGKLAREANRATVTANLTVGDKTVAQFENATISLSAKQLGGNTVDISTSGSGKLYYYWQAEGVSPTGEYEEEDSYIRVRRQFFDRFGKKIHSNHFEQNDLVIVQVSLERLYSGDVENIVITDLLPAGFEVENPRVREIPGMDWVKDASTPSALDLRDDRVNLFVDLTRQRQVYYYAVRAVSPGEFTMGPIGADAMYNAEYHSYHGAGKITITER